MTQPASRPTFVANPAPEMRPTDAAPPPAHVPVTERLALIALLLALVFVASLWALCWLKALGAGLVTWEWLLFVGVPVFGVLLFGVAYVCLWPLQMFHAFKFWLLAAQGDVYHRQESQRLERAAFVRHYKRGQVSAPEPPRIITIRTPAAETQRAGSVVDAQARYADEQPVNTARYSSGDTQPERVTERLSLPPAQWSPEMYQLYEVWKRTGKTSLTMALANGMTRMSWQRAIDGFRERGLLQEFGKGKPFRIND